MTRALAVLLAAVVLAAVFAVAAHHRSAAGPSGSFHPAVVGAVRVSTPLAWKRPLPRHDTRPHSRKPSVTRLLDVTAYCDHSQPTASGVWPRYGMAASNLFRFGTRLRVPGWGVVTVTDRIGWGSQLDLFAGLAPGCEQRALTWGRRELVVEVLP